MNKNLLNEIKRINEMMGNNSNLKLLLETNGKVFDELIKKTIGWERVGRFFDDVFEGTGRKGGKLASQEASEILQRNYDDDFAKSFDELATKSKSELQSYSDSLIKKLRRGATNLTKEELALKTLLEKAAKSNEPIQLTKKEVSEIETRAISHIADKPQYKNLIDNPEGTGIIDDVSAEVQEKIAKGENVTQADIDKLISDKIDLLKNKSGEPLDPRVAAKLKQNSKSNTKYKKILSNVKNNTDYDDVSDAITRNVTGEVEKLPDDLSEMYKGIQKKIEDGEQLTQLEKQFKDSVEKWQKGEEPSLTNVRRYGEAISKNNTAEDLLNDENQRLFEEAGIGKKSFADKTNYWIDWTLGRGCKNKAASKYFCQKWNKFFEVTGIEFFVGVFQRVLKSLDDIILRVNGNIKISYSRLADTDLFQTQYKEILNNMQKIAAEKRKGWETELAREQERLIRLIETRRPTKGIKSEDIATEYKAAFLNAVDEIKKKLEGNDHLPGVKDLLDWMSKDNAQKTNAFDQLDDVITYLKLANEQGDSWFWDITPLQREIKTKSDEIIAQQEKAVIQNGEEVVENDAKKIMEKVGKSSTKMGAAFTEIFNGIKKFFGDILFQKVSNWLRYGMFTNLNAFKTVLAKYGYVGGLAIVYVKLVIAVTLVRIVGFFIETILGMLFQSVYKLTGDLTTAQTVLLIVTHPIETFKAQVLGNKESKKFLYLEFDRWREMKNNFGTGIRDIIFDPKNLTVIPIIEEIMKAITSVFYIGKNTYKALSGQENEEMQSFNSDISAINPGVRGGLPLVIVSEFIRMVGNWINGKDTIYDLEKGIQGEIDKLKGDLDKFKNQNLKELVGPNYDRYVKEYKLKKLEDISGYFTSGCLGSNAGTMKALFENYYDVNPKYLKPFNPTNQTKQDEQEIKNQAKSLEYRIRELQNTEEEDDKEKKNFDLFGFVINGEMYYLQKGPMLVNDAGEKTFLLGDNISNVIKSNNTLGNQKCCTSLGYYIAKEGTNTWYCLSSNRIMELFGGNKTVEEKVDLAQDLEAKDVFSKIEDLTKKIIAKKAEVDLAVGDVKYWIDVYNRYKVNPKRYQTTIAGAQREMGNLAKKVTELKSQAEQIQNIANTFLQKSELRKTEAMEVERKAFFQRMVNLQQYGVKVVENRLDLMDMFIKDDDILTLLNSIKESYGIYYNKSKIINEMRNTKRKYLIEDEERFGENKFDHWYDTFTFEKYDEKNNEFKEIETDTLKHGKIKNRFSDFIKNYDGDDAFVRSVIDTHPEIVRFRYLKDQADINESYTPIGLGLILQSIREARGGEYEIFSVSRQDGNWNIVKGNFTKKEMANMVLKKEIPAEKQPKKRENGLESLKKKEYEGTSKLTSNEKEGLENLPKRIKEKLKEKMQRGWTTETPPNIFSDFYDESEIKSVFNDEIKIYKLNPTKDFFDSLEKNSSHIIVKRGFCRSLTLAKKDSDITAGQKRIVSHILSKCNHKFNNRLGLKYTPIK